MCTRKRIGRKFYPGLPGTGIEFPILFFAKPRVGSILRGGNARYNPSAAKNPRRTIWNSVNLSGNLEADAITRGMRGSRTRLPVSEREIG